MTNVRDSLSLIVEFFAQSDRVLICAQLIRISGSTGQDSSVIITGNDFKERLVYRILLALVQVLKRLRRASFGSDQDCLRSRCAHHLPGLL